MNTRYLFKQNNLLYSLRLRRLVLFLSVIAMFFVFDFNSYAQSTKNFTFPRTQGYRLDWCYKWAEGCGETAATAWCKTQGYSSASSWAIANNIGATYPTYVIGGGKVCNQDFCDGFSYITCVSTGGGRDPGIPSCQVNTNYIEDNNAWCYGYVKILDPPTNSKKIYYVIDRAGIDSGRIAPPAGAVYGGEMDTCEKMAREAC